MARGQTLGELVEQLRAELGDSLNPAHGVDETRPLKHLLKRTQERLYDGNWWPHLRVREEFQTSAGEIYYDWPQGVNPDRLVGFWVKWSDHWMPVNRGIDPDEYNAWDSDRRAGAGYDYSERSDPIVRWELIDTGERAQAEVWPRPASPTTIRLIGMRSLRPLLANDDRADLDDQLLTLWAAAEMLKRRESADADYKLSLAQQRLDTLLANSATGPHREPCIVGGGGRVRRGPMHWTPPAGHHLIRK